MTCAFPATYDSGADLCRAVYAPTVGNYIYSTTFTVPANVYELSVELIGGRGSDWNPTLLGGRGAAINATLAVTAGNSFQLSSLPTGGSAAANSYCWNNLGVTPWTYYTLFAGYGGSYVKMASTSNPSGVFAVAGGGGGPGCGLNNASGNGGVNGGIGANGGDAGLPAYGSTPEVPATAGGNYTTAPYNNTGGGPGTQIAGGAGGTGDIANGTAGSSLAGGNSANNGAPGGGGGGGYFGGGGGGSRGAGGGGGSSKVVGMNVTSTSLSNYALIGGKITISYAVISTPAAPGTLTVTPGDSSAQVSWASVYQATSYTVTSNPAGATCVVTGTSANCTGLTNGTAYTFTATATNARGTSAASAASTAVTPAAPVVAPATPPPPLSPQIGGFTNNQVQPGQPSTLTLHGSNFTASTAVTVFSQAGSNFPVPSKPITETELEIKLPALDPGYYDLEIVNDHGKVRWGNAFKVLGVKRNSDNKVSYKSWVISAFAPGLSKLTSIQKNLVREAAATKPGLSATCTGYTEGPRVLPSDKALALSRAKAVCENLKARLGRGFSYSISGVTEKQVGAAIRRVVVVFK